MKFDIENFYNKYKKRFNGNIPDSEYFNIIENFREQVGNAMDDLGHVNIIMAGGTGVGKSTLINAVFSCDKVETGMGKPVTQIIEKIEDDNFPVTIYDTMGFELSGNNSINELKDKIKDLVLESRVSPNPKDWIHMVWYCISLGKPKIQESEIDYINALCELGIPVILTITQSTSKRKAQELKEKILEYNINVKDIIPLLAQDYDVDIDDEIKTIKAFNVDYLVEKSIEYLPEAAKTAFIASQKANMLLKQKEARKCIKGFAASAFTACTIPLPLTDAPVLILNEIAMMAKISAFYGVAVDKKMLLSCLSMIVGCSGATVLGKSVVAGLCKLMPGLGNAAGMIISSATAAAITYALGEGYLHIMSLVEKGEIKKKDIFSDETIGKMKIFVKSELAKKRDENGESIE